MEYVNKYFPWIAYPMVLTMGILLHLTMLASGFSLMLSTFTPIIFGATLITVFELTFPHLRIWKVNSRDVTNDLVYMIVVQVILPRVLGFIIAITLLRYMQTEELSIDHIWPHYWPIGAQVISMILIADFFRYWLHRFSHTVPFLWRFHAVHHSPGKLYWLNTGRFHPVDKTLQFLFDAFPFIVLGVSEYAIALYFVFYAINGFFQHSNIELRFGFLNYIISSAELHRWHHSRIASESNTNYGNNIIIWDLLFGTWYLPENRHVGELGLVNKNYPDSFIDQLRTPFTYGLDKKDIQLRNMKESLINHLIRFSMFIMKYVLWIPFIRAARNPASTQKKLLKEIIKKNRNTLFGEDHSFANIKSVSDYRDKVKIQDYEMLKPYIDEQEKHGKKGLTDERPVMYTKTSGTTGVPKYIPVLDTTLKSYKRNLQLFSYVQYQACPEAFNGKLLGIMGPVIEGYLDSGTPYGSASGIFYKNMPRLLNQKYVIPHKLFEIEDYGLKYSLILRLAIVHKDVTYMASANPSTFLMLLNMLYDNTGTLIDEIEHGTFARIGELAKELRRHIAPGLEANPVRAKELRAIYMEKKTVDFADIWPDLGLLSTWTGGSCGIALEALMNKLPDKTKILELGYLSSEFRGTITVDPDSNEGIPTIQDNFFEFIEKDKWEAGIIECKTVDQLSMGSQYYIFITTISGLYRYNMNDIVEVTGCFENTPTVRFVQKGKGITNITGEKVYESQALEAVRKSEKELGITSTFFVFLADRKNFIYQVFIEFENNNKPDLQSFAGYIDKYLGEINCEYNEKRKSGRLKPLQASYLRTGTAEAYKKYCIAKGQNEGQFKIIALNYKDDFKFSFDDYLLH